MSLWTTSLHHAAQFYELFVLFRHLRNAVIIIIILLHDCFVKEEEEE